MTEQLNKVSTKRQYRQDEHDLVSPWVHGDQARNKRRKLTMSDQHLKLGATTNQILDQFICPITKELPIDPVIAEDGNIYERSAIEHLIGVYKPIGTKLVPVVHVRNAIESIARSGAIFGNRRRMANNWLQKFEKEQQLQETKAKAVSGCAEAMATLGYWHAHGMNGLQKSDVEAFSWFRKAADCGHVKTMVLVGCFLLEKNSSTTGIPRNVSEALHYIRLAAEKGSDVGAYNIGIAHANGLHGLVQDAKVGTFWLSKVVDGSCEVKHCGMNMISNAKRILERLANFYEATKEKIVIEIED